MSKPVGGHSTAKNADKGNKHRKKKHRERPCPNPPAVPTGVAVTFKAREAKTHLEFSAKIKWNGVFEDEQGHKIPGQGVEIDHYEVQFQPTDAAGVPKETEDGDSRVRRYHKKSVKGVKIIDATIVSGTTAEFTTKKAHGFVNGEKVQVQDVKPPAYNGRHTITSVPSSTTFRADIGASPGDLEDEGTVEGEPDPTYNIIVEHVSNPRKWHWQARVRAWDNKNCPSDWSAWTSVPNLPWTGANPEPPAPTITSLTFDKKGGARHNRLRAIVQWNEVEDWDIPGFDQEPDMDSYVIQLQFNDGGGWDAHAKRRVQAKDDDVDTTRRTRFGRIKRSNTYRVRARGIDRFNRRGTWTDWYPNDSGTSVSASGTPSSLQNVSTISAKRRAGIKWEAPLDTNLPDDSIATVHVQVSRNAGFSDIVDEAYKNPGKGSHRYAVPKGDRSLKHYVRARSIDDAGAVGSWQPGSSGSEVTPEADDDTTNAIPGENSISNLAQFVDDIRPIAIVTSLPPLPNQDYPPGSLVLLSTDWKLYRNQNNTWTKAVDGADVMQGTIGAEQIAANSIVANHIQAGQISAGMLASSLALFQEVFLTSGGRFFSGNPNVESNYIAIRNDAKDKIQFVSKDAQNQTQSVGMQAAGGNVHLINGYLVFGPSELLGNTGRIHLGNAASPPTPGAGVILYAAAGKLRWKGPDGVEHVL